MNVKVQGERILVIQDEKKENVVNGIYLPDTMDKKRPSIGTVVAIGNGNTVKDCIKVGDRVRFDIFSGVEVDIDGKDYKVLDYHNVLMVM